MISNLLIIKSYTSRLTVKTHKPYKEKEASTLLSREITYRNGTTFYIMQRPTKVQLHAINIGHLSVKNKLTYKQ